MSNILKKNLKVVISLVFVLVFGYFLYFQFFINDSSETNFQSLSARELLSQMTLEEKVGQMLMVGFWGTEPDRYINKMIVQRNVGGIIFLGYNIEGADQFRTLINSLNVQSSKMRFDIPLFYSVDQEGGLVSRARIDGVEELTAQADIESEEQAYEIAKGRGEELRSLGFNVNYSPMLDYITEEESFLYERSFRGGVKDFGSYGVVMVNGYQESGIIAVPKHFPGHANDSVDSHEKLPVVDINRDELNNTLEPFAQAILMSDIKMLMVGHISYPQIDYDYPTSLSSIFITDILKDEMGYEGLVITDDMEMGAMEENYSVEESSVLAVKAGVDILLYSSTPEKQALAYDSIISAVENGEIAESQIDESVLKILELKKAF